jgi:hypothetical protein
VCRITIGNLKRSRSQLLIPNWKVLMSDEVCHIGILGPAKTTFPKAPLIAFGWCILQ